MLPAPRRSQNGTKLPGSLQWPTVQRITIPTTMTISMTASGLDEINNATTVYDSTSLYRGYSACTVRITYACTVNSSADVVYGDGGNPNEVQLTWKRTNTDYYDTLEDDCHFYTYGLDLTKKFNDSKGNFSKVQFVMHNDTDNYWVKAQLNEAEGVYYVTEHVAEEANATKFVPVSAGGQPGKVIVKGLEDDAYTITEVATDAGVHPPEGFRESGHHHQRGRRNLPHLWQGKV